MMAGDIKTADLPGLWADKYDELLGLRPNDMADGVLQDVHWSSGAVGYFPSYAIGTAYGAQLVSAMKMSVDIDGAVKKEDISPVSGWLKENIHKHGMLLLPDDLLKQAVGESFDPKHYVNYLSEKFTALYSL
jgi:carboxypeptidase Taq